MNLIFIWFIPRNYLKVAAVISIRGNTIIATILLQSNMYVLQKELWHYPTCVPVILDDVCNQSYSIPWNMW